jgi:cell volume regulation protein A
MFAVEGLILSGAVLVLIGIASSRFSARFGMPALAIFIAIGMLAGSEGVGGIGFENYHLAHGLGTVALAVILFDGGLRTDVSILRPALAPALSLATVGVLLTAAITGAAAMWILGLAPLQGLLLGSIVASTDAAAVFTVFRFSGLHLPERLATTLELESGSNDPMAVFLTIGLLQLLLGEMEPGWALAGLFVMQMGVGGVVGLVVGRAARFLLGRVELAAAGLYPVFAAAAGLLAFGLAAELHGSGFLAVYLAGIVVGNGRVPFQRGILQFMDGMAWLSQIALFVLLGLLSFPSRLLAVAGPGLLVTAVLVLVARPLAVVLSLFPLRFTGRELAFISWAGLKGAVPIVLGTYPLLLGLPGGEALFHVVFFVVLVSAVTQGWTLPAVARALGLQRDGEPEPPATLEITTLRNADADIVEYTVGEGGWMAGRSLRDVALPHGAVVAMITRGEHIIPPRGSTRVEPGDRLFFVLSAKVRRVMDRLLAGEHAPGPVNGPEFPLAGDTTLQELEEFYGVVVEADPAWTLNDLMHARLGERVAEGRGITTGEVKLHIRRLHGSRVDEVGLRLL